MSRTTARTSSRTTSRTTSRSAGSSAYANHRAASERAADRGKERDSFVMAGLATLPLLTFVLTRHGVSRLEAVGIALFAAVLLAGWRRGASGAAAYDARSWAVGARAEEATAAVLDRVVDRHTRVFHDVRLPGRRENIDHLLVGPHGVVVVETKRWSGSVVVGRAVRHNRLKRTDVIDQVGRLQRSAGRELGGVAVEAFVCVHGARVRPAWFRRRAEIDGVAFGDPRALARWLRRRRVTFRPAEVRGLVARLEA